MAIGQTSNAQMRDYVRWHDDYGDPNFNLWASEFRAERHLSYGGRSNQSAPPLV